jgi:hypothetical protein
MRDNRIRPMLDLNRTNDDDLISGRLGVFAASWTSAGEKQPQVDGPYLVSVGNVMLQIARYEQGSGWSLRGTQDEGFESLIGYWMDLPKLPRGR